MFIESIAQVIQNIRWNDFLDIGLMSFVFYRLLLLIQGTRTVQMLIGFSAVVASYFLFRYLDLTGMNAIFNNLFASLVVILVVIFQGDIRLALTEIGQTKFFNEKNEVVSSYNLDRLAAACEFFSQTNTGALIVIENKIGLKSFIDSGTTINADLSSALMMSIFFKNSPLHDGAVVLDKKLKIISAGCILPLSTKKDLIERYGTRHRAAIGVMEESDAIVIVVSEETGTISFGVDGKLEALEDFALKSKLYSMFTA